MASRTPTRRAVLRAGVALGVLAALPGCSSPYAGRRLVLATGSTEGEYYRLGRALGTAWQQDLGLDTAPEVRSTSGSLDNLRQLTDGTADLALSQVDAAAIAWDRTPRADPRSPRALARIYDDAVHLVVPAASAVLAPADLRGARVSTGAPDSGVSFVATRLLQAAGLRPGYDLSAEQLDLPRSAEALRAGRLDAFFWVGALPTQRISALAEQFPIRLVDLESIVPAARRDHPEYAAGTVPVGSYGLATPISTLLVRNVLLATADLPDDLAAGLVESLFDAQQALAEASPAALTIDPRAAIGTQPVPLHPGAEQFYRSARDG